MAERFHRPSATAVRRIRTAAAAIAIRRSGRPERCCRRSGASGARSVQRSPRSARLLPRASERGSGALIAPLSGRPSASAVGAGCRAPGRSAAAALVLTHRGWRRQRVIEPRKGLAGASKPGGGSRRPDGRGSRPGGRNSPAPKSAVGGGSTMAGPGPGGADFGGGGARGSRFGLRSENEGPGAGRRGRSAGGGMSAARAPARRRRRLAALSAGGGTSGRGGGADRAGWSPRDAAGRFRFDLANRFLESEPLTGDVGFGKRRFYAAQLRDQGGARTLVHRPAGLAGTLSDHGFGDQRVIIGHQLPNRTRAATLSMRTLRNGRRIRQDHF